MINKNNHNVGTIPKLNIKNRRNESQRKDRLSQ